MSKKTCPNCGKPFMPWRGKAYCSDRCRKQAENRRLRGAKELSGITLPARENLEENIAPEQALAKPLRGDETPVWAASNECTHKLVLKGSAIGWAMHIKNRGWFGRVRDERGDWAFGPSRLERVRSAVEAWINHAVFEKRDDERMWRGDCRPMLDVIVATPATPTE